MHSTNLVCSTNSSCWPFCYIGINRSPLALLIGVCIRVKCWLGRKSAMSIKTRFGNALYVQGLLFKI